MRRVVFCIWNLNAVRNGADSTTYMNSESSIGPKKMKTGGNSLLSEVSEGVSGWYLDFGGSIMAIFNQ